MASRRTERAVIAPFRFPAIPGYQLAEPDTVSYCRRDQKLWIGVGVSALLSGGDLCGFLSKLSLSGIRCN